MPCTKTRSSGSELMIRAARATRKILGRGAVGARLGRGRVALGGENRAAGGTWKIQSWLGAVATRESNVYRVPQPGKSHATRPLNPFTVGSQMVLCNNSLYWPKHFNLTKPGETTWSAHSLKGLSLSDGSSGSAKSAGS